MNFTYVFAGMEGSAHDSRVIAHAQAEGFTAPNGDCYFVADAGYRAKSRLTLVPYSGVRYHLKEFERAGKRPANAKELFNLRHASIRNVIERCFGVFKRRFRIFDKPRDGFSIRTQRKLVFALTAVHNFMDRHGHNAEQEYRELQKEREREGSPSNMDQEVNGNQLGLDSDDDSMLEKRDRIAEQMWKEYQDFLRRSGR